MVVEFCATNYSSAQLRSFVEVYNDEISDHWVITTQQAKKNENIIGKFTEIIPGYLINTKMFNKQSVPRKVKRLRKTTET